MKLVLGYNGSDSSNKALMLVQKYAKDFQATVHLLMSLIGENTLATASTWNVTGDDIVKEAKSRLEVAKKTLVQEGITCETHLLISGLEPGEDIVDFAKKIDADFIVVGIGRTSRVGKMFFGSNAQYVILEAFCPVITVK